MGHNIMNAISVNKLTKTFTGRKKQTIIALHDLSFHIKSQNFVCILGESGCGKSTLLNLLANLEQADSGTIELFGQALSREALKKTQMVFQDHSLLPWRNVLDNVALSLEIRNTGKQARRLRALDILGRFGLEKFARNYPYELSGGMRQRVAIARAIMTEPEILFMDEPFGALDAHTRIYMQQELLEFWLNAKRTIIFVTHSVEEAVFLSTQIIVLGGHPGRILTNIQNELPYPRDRWTSDFGDYCKKLMEIMGNASGLAKLVTSERTLPAPKSCRQC